MAGDADRTIRPGGPSTGGHGPGECGQRATWGIDAGDRQCSLLTDCRPPSLGQPSAVSRGVGRKAKSDAGKRVITARHQPQRSQQAQLVGHHSRQPFPGFKDRPTGLEQRASQRQAAILPGETRPEFSCRCPTAEGWVVAEGFDGNDDIGIDQLPREVKRVTVSVSEQIGGLISPFRLEPGHLLTGCGRQDRRAAIHARLGAQQVKRRGHQDRDVAGGDSAIRQAFGEALHDSFRCLRATGKPRRQGDHDSVTGDDMLPQRRAAERFVKRFGKSVRQGCLRQARRTSEVCQQRSRPNGESQRAGGGVIEVDIQERDTAAKADMKPAV